MPIGKSSVGALTITIVCQHPVFKNTRIWTITPSAQQGVLQLVSIAMQAQNAVDVIAAQNIASTTGNYWG